MTVEDDQIKKAYDDLNDWNFEGFEHFEHRSDAELIQKRWELFQNFLNEAEIWKGTEPFDILFSAARFGAATVVAELRGGEEGQWEVLWGEEDFSETIFYSDAIPISFSLLKLFKSDFERRPDEARSRIAHLRKMIDKMEEELDNE
jgi:hypothetical protein